MAKPLRVVIVILCVVLCCLLTACGTVTYSVTISTGGERTMLLRVKHDQADTAEQRAYVKSFLEEVCRSRNANGRQCELSEEGDYVTLKEHFDSGTDYYIAMGYTGDEPNDDPMPQVNLNAYFFEYVSEMSLATRATVLTYALDYAIGDWQRIEGHEQLMSLWHYYCDGCAGNPTYPLQPVYAHLALQDVSHLRSATVAALSDGQYGAALADALTAWLADKGYNLREVDFRFCYEHVYKSVYPKQYTKQYVDSATGNTVYEWDMTLADIADANIVLYQKVPRVWVWELTAVAVGLATIAVILTIIWIKRRKEYNAAREVE